MLPDKYSRDYKILPVLLGLVIILFVSWQLVEGQVQKNKVEVLQDTNKSSGKIEISDGKQQDPVQIVKNQQSKQTKFPERYKAVDNKSLGKIKKDEKVIYIEGDSLVFIDIIRPPVFPGCEKYEDNREKLKVCMSRRIKMFVEENFDRQVIKHLKTKPGEQVRVNVLFMVNEKGQVVDIKMRSRYKALENEIVRVLKRLPKLKPGLDARRKPTRVRYGLAMIFQVEKINANKENNK